MDEMMIKSPSQALNLINIIYDDEFVSLINSLSSTIKDFYKSSRKSVSELNNTLTSFSNQTLVSKCLLGEIKASNSFEKVPQFSDRLENIKDTQVSFDKTINVIDRDLIKFFEDAKLLFKKMKLVRNKKIEDLISKGNQFNITPNTNTNNTRKYMTNRTSSAAKISSSSSSAITIQKQIRSTRENKSKSKHDGNNNNNSNYNNDMQSPHKKLKSNGSNHESRSVSPNYKISSITNDSTLSSSKLALNVISFLEEMIRLQESIMKHSGNVAEKKRKFELQKNELKNLAEKTLNLTNAYLTAKTNNYTNVKDSNQSSNVKSKENILQIQAQCDNEQIMTLKREVKGLEDSITLYKEEIKKLTYDSLIKTNLYEDTIVSLKEENKALNTELRRKSNQYTMNKTLESELNKIKGEIKNEQEDQKHNTQIKYQYDTIRLNNEIQLLKNQIKENEVEKQSLMIKAEEYKRQIEQLSSDILSNTTTIAKLQEQTKTLMNEIQVKNEEKEEMLYDKSQLCKEIETSAKEKNALQINYDNEIKKLNDQFNNKIAKEAAEKKKIMTLFESKDKEIVIKKTEIINLGQEIAKLKLLANINEEDKKKSLKNEMDLNKQLKTDLIKKDTTIEQLNQMIKENNISINQLKNKIDSIKKEKNTFGITKLFISKQEPFKIKASYDTQVFKTKSSKDKNKDRDKDNEIELMNNAITNLKHTNEELITNLNIKVKLGEQAEKKIAKLIQENSSLAKELDSLNKTHEKQFDSSQTLSNDNKQLKEEASLNKKQIEELQSKNKNEKGHYISIIEELQSKLQSERKELEAQIEEVKQVCSTEKSQLENQLQLLKQFTSTDKREAELRTMEINRSNSIKEKEITDLNDKIAKYASEVRDKNKTIANITNELSKLKQMNNQSEEQKSIQLKTEIANNHQLNNKLQAKDEELVNQMNKLNKEIQNSKLLSDTVSSLQLKLNQTESQLNNEKSKSKELMAKITHYESVIGSNEKEHSELQAQYRNSQANKDKLVSQLSIENKNLGDDIAQLNLLIAQLESENKAKVNQLKEQSTSLVTEKEKLNDSLNKLSKEQNKNKEMLNQIGSNEKKKEDQVSISKNKFNEIEEFNKSLRLDIEKLINEKKELADEISKLKKEIEKSNKQKREIEEEKGMEVIIIQEEYRKVLKDNEMLKTNNNNKDKETGIIDCISPKTHKLILDKKYNSMKWVLVENNSTHECQWIPIDHISDIKAYNKYKTEEKEQLENMQMSIKKLEQKEDMISKLSFENSKLKDQAMANSKNDSGIKQKSKLSDKGLFGMDKDNNNNSQYNQSIGSSNNRENKDIINQDTVPLEKFNAVLKELNDANKRMTLIQTESIKLRKMIKEKDQTSFKGNVSNNNDNNLLGNINTEDNRTPRDRDEDDTIDQLETQLKYFKNLYKELNDSMNQLTQHIKVLLPNCHTTSKTKGVVEAICKIIQLNEDETNKIINEDVKKKGILGNFWKKKE